MALIARVSDTHANLWSALAVRPPVGACQLPINVRFVDNHGAVVASYSNTDLGKASGLKPRSTSSRTSMASRWQSS